MTDLLIIALGVMAGLPTLIGLLSFALWQNGFRIMGIWFIVRLSIVLTVICWAIYLLPGGSA